MLLIVSHGLTPGIGGDLIDQRVLGGQHHVGGAEQRIGPRGEHTNDVVGVLHGEVNHRALAAADPVALHQLDRLGPVHDVEVRQQAIGERGDAEHPLPERALVHRVVAAIGASFVGDFLVGQYRAERRAPVDRNFRKVSQAVIVQERRLIRREKLMPLDRAEGRADYRIESFGSTRHQVAFKSDAVDLRGQLLLQFLDGARRIGARVEVAVEQLQEDPLRPAVILDVGRGQGTVPVVAEAERLELAQHVGDVLLGGDARVDAVLDGVLLGGQTERVEAHRVQHVEALHPLVARDDIGGDVTKRMADVQADARGIREHIEHVILGTGGVEAFGAGVRHAEGALGFPSFLPALFDGAEVVSHLVVSGFCVRRHVRFPCE